MKYKVIKNFGCAVKGDVLENSEEIPEMFTMRYEKDGSLRTMTLSKDFVDICYNDGFLAGMVEEPVEKDTKKLKKVSDFVNDKLESYKEDYNNMLEAYNNREMPECAKVEAETVYFNMNKLLNKVKELLNE